MSWTHIQGTAISGTGATSTITGSLSSVVSGHLIVVSIGYYNTGPTGSTTLSVEDSTNNVAYTFGVGANLSQNTAEVGIFWYVTPTGASTFTVTATSAGAIAIYPSMAIDEYSFTSGATISSDSTSSTSGGTNGTGTLTSGNLTLTGTDLIVVCMSDDGGSGTATAGSGYTLGGCEPWVSAATDGMSSEYQLNVSSSPAAVSINFASTATTFGIAAIAFKPSGGVSPGSSYWPGLSVFRPKQRPALADTQFSDLYG